MEVITNWPQAFVGMGVAFAAAAVLIVLIIWQS
jgi:hypothetical protein